jgi:hypothetical protein
VLSDQTELGEIGPADSADMLDRIDQTRRVSVDASADLFDEEAV